MPLPIYIHAFRLIINKNIYRNLGVNSKITPVYMNNKLDKVCSKK